HFQKIQEREKHGHVGLEQDGHQRHHQEYPLMKPGNLAFALAAEEDPLARVGHQRSCPPGGMPAGGFRRRAASGGWAAGVPEGGGALVSGAGAVPRVPDFAGAAGRATGGAPGADGEFLPASALGGVAVLVGAAALGTAGFFPVAGAVPPVPFFAGTAGRATGGVLGAGGEFLPASALDGAVVFAGAAAPGAGAAGFFPAGPRGYPTGPAAPEFPSLVKSAGLAPGGFSPYVCFCSRPNARYCARSLSASVPVADGTADAGVES